MWIPDDRSQWHLYPEAPPSLTLTIHQLGRISQKLRETFRDVGSFLVLGQVWSQGLTVWHLRHVSSYLKWLSRLILHFCSALDTNNCCDERFGIIKIIVLASSLNNDQRNTHLQNSAPQVRTFVGLSESFARISYDPSKRWQKKSQPETELWAAGWEHNASQIQTE